MTVVEVETLPQLIPNPKTAPNPRTQPQPYYKMNPIPKEYTLLLIPADPGA